MSDSESIHNSVALVTTEVDYDTNPTELYNLIERKKISEAVSHCKKFPKESATWIVKKDETGIRWKLLPLHAALIIRAGDILVKSLIETFPNGVKEKDDQGMLALHLAFRHSASESTINAILEGFPDGIYSKDQKGRTPLELVSKGSGKRKGSKFRLLAANMLLYSTSEKNESSDIEKQLNEANEKIEVLQQQLRESELSSVIKSASIEDGDIAAHVEELEEKLRASTENYDRALTMFEKRKKLHDNEKKFLTEQLENANEASESTMEMYKKAQENHGKDISTMKKKHRDLRNENSQCKKQIGELVSGLDLLTKSCEDEKISAQSAINKYKDDIKSYENTVQEVKARMVQVENKAKADIFHMTGKIDGLEDELMTKESEHMGEIETYEGKVRSLTNQMNNLQNEIGQLKLEYGELDAKYIEQIAETKNCKDKIISQENSISKLVNQKKKLEDELTLEKDRYNSIESQLENEIQAAKVKTKNITELEEKVNELESEKNSMEFHIASTKQDYEERAKRYANEKQKLLGEEQKVKDILTVKESEIKLLQQENGVISTEYKTKVNESTSLTQKIKEILKLHEEEKFRITSEKTKLSNSLDEAREKIKILETNVIDLKNEAETQREKINELTNHIKVYEDEKKESSIEKIKLTGEVQKCQEEIMTLELSITELKKSAELQKTELLRRTADLNSLIQNEKLAHETDLQVLRYQNEDLKTEKTNLTETNSLLESTLQETKRSLEIEKKKGDSYLKIVDLLKSQISDNSEQLKSQSRIYDTEKGEMEEMVSILQDQLNQLNFDNETKDKTVKDLRAKLNDLKTDSDFKIAKLEEMIYDMEDICDASRVEIDNLKRQMLESSIEKESLSRVVRGSGSRNDDEDGIPYNEYMKQLT